MISGRNVLLLATADWDAPLWTNKQHVARRLAEKNRVLYVESLGLRAPRFSPRDLGRIWRRLRRAVAPRSPAPAAAGGAEILSPLAVPFWGSSLARSWNAFYLGRWLSRQLAARGIERYLLWTYVPFASLLMDRIFPSPEAVIYHCVDDLSAFPRIPAAATSAAERELCRRADVVFFTSRRRQDDLGALCRRPVFVGNAAAAPDPGVKPSQDLGALPRPRVGFMGAVDSAKLDWEILERLAGPGFAGSVVLVGPLAATEDPARLRRLLRSPKALWKDALPQAEALSWMAACDVLAIPYALNDYTRCVFPMKLFEYLGLGKPVVSTPLPEVTPFAAQVELAASPEAFAQAALSLARGDDAGLRRGRRELAARHTWEGLLETMSEQLAAAAGASR